ncbi:MAG TPA: PP2C family serine/threonine-protein phosphatase [Chlamydiales bacterium]|nr:PP2C family serine/threonine-protein phosphatase [Chlamydiales bacterium]
MGIQLKNEMQYLLSAYGLSDKGLVRQNNEDFWACVPDLHLFMLADGMGGHQAGEVAAKEAVVFLSSHLHDLLEKFFSDAPNLEKLIKLLQTSISDTNRYIYKMSFSHELLQGMGTTLCCLYFYGDRVIYSHVGDSRIYRLRKNQLEQLTQDHSLFRELVDRGVSFDARKEPVYKNIITQAIGTEEVIAPSINVSLVEPNDLYLLCSDGLSDYLSKAEIEQCLNQPHSVEERVRALICAAKKKGGYDNVTVVLVEVQNSDTKNSENESDLPR